MHHKNNRYSSSNHSNPQHQKNNNNQFPTKPAPQSGQKKSVLNRIRERFQEKPATAEEVKQLRLDAQREIYKTQKQKAKSARPSRFSGFGGGSSGPSYRRGSSRAPPQTGSWLLDSGNSRGGFMDSSDSLPSLDFITGANSQSRGRRKQESGFGKGLTDLF